MNRPACRALGPQRVFQLLVFFLSTQLVCAEQTTTATTITSTSFVTTTTVTLRLSAFTSVITETLSNALSSSATGSTASAAMASSGAHLKSAVLNSTNYYRAQHQASALSWNVDLADYAANYSSACIWQHSGGPHGENLAAGYASIAASIDAWADEESKYNYAKPKFSEATGHYTQLVWKNTTAVGCAAVQCDNSASNGVNGLYLVCEYDPPGNVKGQYREEVSKPGEGQDGKPGLGAATSLAQRGWQGLMGALVAVSVLMVACI